MFKYHGYLRAEPGLEPRGLSSRTQERFSPRVTGRRGTGCSNTFGGPSGTEERGTAAPLSGSWGRGLHPPTPSAGGRRRGPRVGCRALAVAEPAPAPPPPPGLAPRAPGLLPAPDGESREGLICRKTFSSDLVSGSRALLPGVRPGSSQHPSPGPRLDEKPRWWQKKLEPRRRSGREGPGPLRASLPLAKVNPTPPTLGRCAPRAPGSRGRGAGGGSPGPGRPVWDKGRASAPAASRIPGQVLGDSWAPGRLGRGAGARRRDPGGGGVDPLGRKRRLIRDVFMLICTWLGFSRAEKGCRIEGKKFRRAGNFLKPLIPRLKTARFYRSPVCGFGEVGWGLKFSPLKNKEHGSRFFLSSFSKEVKVRPSGCSRRIEGRWIAAGMRRRCVSEGRILAFAERQSCRSQVHVSKGPCLTVSTVAQRST